MKVRQDVRSVYLILNEENGRVKIGYSTNPKKRFKNIMTQSGCRMKLHYHTKLIYNYAHVEKSMHDLFIESRGIGEWFEGISLGNATKNLKLLASSGEVCKIVTMYDSGSNATIIAKKLNVSRSGVIKYLTSIGYIDGKGVVLDSYTAHNTLPFDANRCKSKTPPVVKEKLKEVDDLDFAKKFEARLREGLNENYIEPTKRVVKSDKDEPSDFKGFTKGDIAEMVRKNNIKMGRTKHF